MIRSYKNKTHYKTFFILSILLLFSGLAFQFTNVDMKYISFAMSIRTPKLIAMIIAAFCIGSASIVFQSLINNTIVTPCLLGMNSLYILIHTTIIFVLGSTSFIASNKIVAFVIDLVIMGASAIIIYGILFKKTGGNVLYILLAGTVLTTLFTSITSTLQRIMDPNEFETLQNSLIASFNKVNSEIILLGLVGIVVIIAVLWKDLKLLDVITLGKHQAINLGVDYDKTMYRLMIGVTLFIAIATAMVGPISFLGLMIANLARQIFKTYKHSYLIIGTSMIGMIVLLIGQTIIEQVFSFNANIASLINIGGGIYFLYLILKDRG